MVERKRRSHFLVSIQAKRRKRRREEIQEWNSCLELSYLLVWNLYVWICWLGNPPNSLFAYVWGLKNPISI